MQKTYIVGLMTLLTAVLIFQPQVKAETERINLKEQFKAGQSFKAIEKMELEVQIGVAENNLKMKSASGLGYGYTVKNVTKEGGKTINLAIYSLYNELPGGMGISTPFDSTDPLALPQANNLFPTCLVGQEIEVEFQPDDTVSNVKLSDAFLDWILQYSKNEKVPLTKELLSKQIVQALEGQVAKSGTSLEQGVFPDKPVTVGETWEKEAKINNAGFSMTFLTTYKLRQRKNGLALVEVAAKVLEAGSESGNDTYRFLNLSGWLKGTITVREADGWMPEFDMEFLIDGEVDLESSDDSGSETETGETATEKGSEASTAVAAKTVEKRAESGTQEDQTEKAQNETVPTGKFRITASLSRQPWE